MTPDTAAQAVTTHVTGGTGRRSFAPAASSRLINLGLFAASVSGYLVFAYIVWWGFSVGRFDAPGGDTMVWDRAGDQVRAGVSPYQLVVENPTNSFWYTPPVAAVFAVTSLLPPMVQWLATVALEVAALRYIAGSWRTVGIIGLFPLTAFELVSGNFNMIIVAGIVAAIRGRPELATVMAFLKLAPIVAVDPRDWRRALRVVVGGLLISVPVLWLWPLWFSALVGSYGMPLGIQIPIPFAARAVVALGLLGLRRPWSRAIAAALLIPAFYYASLILVLVILADRRRPLWFRSERPMPLVDRRRRNAG